MLKGSASRRVNSAAGDEIDPPSRQLLTFLTLLKQQFSHTARIGYSSVLEDGKAE